MVCTDHIPVIFQGPIDGDHDVLAVVALLRSEGLPFDLVAHLLKLFGDPVSCVLVGVSVNPAVAEVGHRHHVVVGSTPLRPLLGNRLLVMQCWRFNACRRCERTRGENGECKHRK